MRAVAALLLLALLLAPGCATHASCDECHAAWQAQGVDPRAFDAVNASPRAQRQDPAGLPLPNASLAARWGPRYLMMSASYAPNATGPALTIFLGDAHLQVDGTRDAAALRPLVRGLLANLSLADAAREDRLVAALAAGRPALVDGAPRADLLWARLAPRILGDEDHAIFAGEPVVAGAWRFQFSFPLAHVDATRGGDRLLLDANPRGRYSLLLTLSGPRDEAGARAALADLLGDAGIAPGAVSWPLVPTG